jgi:hypothetical protein
MCWIALRAVRSRITIFRFTSEAGSKIEERQLCRACQSLAVPWAFGLGLAQTLCWLCDRGLGGIRFAGDVWPLSADLGLAGFKGDFQGWKAMLALQSRSPISQRSARTERARGMSLQEMPGK